MIIGTKVLGTFPSAGGPNISLQPVLAGLVSTVTTQPNECNKCSELVLQRGYLSSFLFHEEL